jgi:hypothetical protein
MSDPWIDELLQQNAEIVAVDDEVTALLHRLRELRREERDISEAAGLLVTKLKWLLRLRDQRDLSFPARRDSLPRQSDSHSRINAIHAARKSIFPQ